MEIRQIYYVLEVAKSKNFSKAANALFITQPAISQQINALEEELQVKLFERDTHSVVLTKEGEKFCAYAEKVVRSIDKLMEAFNQSTTKDKTVINVGFFPFYRAAAVMSVIDSFFTANHNVVGRIVEERDRTYEKLEAGELDFAIIKARAEGIKPGVKYDTLLDESLNVLISRQNRLAKNEVLNLKDLEKFPLLVGERNSHFYHEMKALYQKNNIAFHVKFMDTDQADTVIEMVEANAGISLVTESIGKGYVSEKVALIPVEPREKILTFLAYQGKRRLTGAYLAFKNHVRDAYK